MAITVAELKALKQGDKATGERGEWIDLTLISESPADAPAQLSVRPGLEGKTFRVQVWKLDPNPDISLDAFDDKDVRSYMLATMGPPQHGDKIPDFAEVDCITYGFHGWLIDKIERNVDDEEVVERWHNNVYGESPAELHDFLGMDWDAYKEWVQQSTPEPETEPDPLAEAWQAKQQEAEAVPIEPTDEVPEPEIVVPDEQD